MAQKHAGHSHRYLAGPAHVSGSARRAFLRCGLGVTGWAIVVIGFFLFGFFFSGIVLVELPVCWASERASGAVVFRVEGTAEGTGAAAVRAADQNGLLAALGEYLEPYALDGNLSLFQELLENPRPYIRSFERIDTQVDGGVTVVTLRVKVDEEATRRAAASIVFPKVAARARFLVLIAERGVGEEELSLRSRGIAETYVAKALREAGLNNVRGVAAILDEYEEGTLTAQLADDKGIRQVLRENAGDSAIVGRAYVQSELATEGSNLLEHRAALELRIVGASEGAHTLRSEARVLSSEIERGAETALQDACEKIAEDVVPLSVLTVAQSGLGTGVLLVVRGHMDAEGREAILERLKEVPGTGEIEVLRETPSMLRAHVPYTGALGPLYRHLTWDPYKGFRLSAKEVVAREIRLEAIPTSS